MCVLLLIIAKYYHISFTTIKKVNKRLKNSKMALVEHQLGTGPFRAGALWEGQRTQSLKSRWHPHWETKDTEETTAAGALMTPARDSRIHSALDKDKQILHPSPACGCLFPLQPSASPVEPARRRSGDSIVSAPEVTCYLPSGAVTEQTWPEAQKGTVNSTRRIRLGIRWLIVVTVVPTECSGASVHELNSFHNSGCEPNLISL